MPREATAGGYVLEAERLNKIPQLALPAKHFRIINITLQQREHAPHSIPTTTPVFRAFDQATVRVNEGKARSAIQSAKRMYIVFEAISLA